VQDAATRGLLAVNKLENGQLEIDLPAGVVPTETRPALAAPAPTEASAEESRPRRGRRGRGGRGRDREDRPRGEAQAAGAQPITGAVSAPEMGQQPSHVSSDGIGASGERLTRQEAFDLVRKTVASLATTDTPVRASDVRATARELLGRDSESLSDRMFVRILKDAHDSGIVDLRRRGDDFEVAPAAEAESVADQLAKAAAATAPISTTPSVPQPRMGMGPRGASRVRGRLGAPPPELLSVGVVHEPTPISAVSEAADSAVPPSDEKPARGRKTARKKTAKSESAGETPKVARTRAPAKARAKKTTSRTAS
jgi:hypothetical protein